MKANQKNQLTILRPKQHLSRTDMIQFVQATTAYKCSISLRRDDIQVNAKSLLGMLYLNLNTGNCIHIEAFGTDSEEAVQSLSSWFLESF